MRKVLSVLLVLILVCFSLTACFSEEKADGSTTTTKKTTITTQKQQSVEGLVWIPQSGTKYHSSKSCSNMKNPRQVSKSEAINSGYSACKKCY